VICIWLVAATIVAFSEGQPIQQPSIEKYISKEGNFAILFPGKPKETTQTTKSPIGDVKVYTATYATKDGNVYMVSYSDLPEEATKPENLVTLFEGVREGAKGKDGEILDSGRFEFGPDKLPGYDLDVKKDKGDQRVKFRVIVREKRLYQLAVVGSKDFAQGKDAAAFLKSFEISK
jgi:hypothetical protein